MKPEQYDAVLAANRAAYAVHHSDVGLLPNPKPPEEPSGAPPADDPMVNLHHPDLPWRLEKEEGGEPKPEPDRDEKPPGPGRKRKWPME